VTEPEALQHLADLHELLVRLHDAVEAQPAEYDAYGFRL
jgi:hypothetical protein